MNVEELRKLAAELDAMESPVQAAAAYEELIRRGGADLETYLNLAVLYFECVDFGFASAHQINDDFVRLALDRAKATLDRAEVRYGRQNEIAFWRYYFDFIYLGAEPNIEAVQDLLREGPSRLPLFHLLMIGAIENGARKAEEMLKSIQPARTHRHRYIASVLDSVVRSSVG